MIWNSENKYGLVSRAFHWLVAFAMLGLLVVGFFMSDLDKSAFKSDLYFWHKSIGAAVLVFGLLRLFWRFINVQPAAMAQHKKYERILAKTIHIVLYVFVIGMPLSGWVMTSSAGYTVSFFGLFDLPSITAKNEGLRALSREVHEVFAYGIIGVVALHILGALKHELFDRDETMKRMGASVILAIIAILFLSFPLFFELFEEPEETVLTAPVEAPVLVPSGVNSNN